MAVDRVTHRPIGRSEAVSNANSVYSVISANSVSLVSNAIGANNESPGPRRS